MGDLAYSYSQLEEIWQEGGGSAALAPIMAAIALAESSGDPAAVGPGGSWGLWQVQPQDWPQFGQTTDAVTQAQDAVAIEQQQGLGAWSTYTEGTYKQFYSPGTPAADAQAVSSSSSPSATSAASCCVWEAGNLCMDGLIGWSVAVLGAGVILVGVVGAGRALI